MHVNEDSHCSSRCNLCVTVLHFLHLVLWGVTIVCASKLCYNGKYEFKDIILNSVSTEQWNLMDCQETLRIGDPNFKITLLFMLFYSNYLI